MERVGRRIIIPQGLLDPDQINVITIPRNLSRNTPLLVTPARSEGGPLGTRLLPDFRDELAASNQDDNVPGHMEAVPRGCLSDPERSRSTSRDRNVLFNTTPPSGMSQVGDISTISNVSSPIFYDDNTRISNISPPPGMSQFGDNSGISNTSSPPGFFSCGSNARISNMTPPSGMDYYVDSSRISNTSPPPGMSQFGDSSRISNTTPPPGLYSCGSTSRISNTTPPSGLGYYDDSSRISNTSSPPGITRFGDSSRISNTTPPSGLYSCGSTSRISNTTPPSGMGYYDDSSRISNTSPPPGITRFGDSSRISNTTPPSGLYSCGSTSRISNTTPPSGMGYYDDSSRISNTSPPPGMSQFGDSSRISNTTPPPGIYSCGSSSGMSNRIAPSGMGYYDDNSRISNTSPPPGMSPSSGMSYACDNYSPSRRNNTPVRTNTTPPFGLPQLGGTIGTPRTPPPAAFPDAASPSSMNATQSLSREPSPPPNMGNFTQPIPGGNTTFSRMCSSGVAPGELGIIHVSSRSVTQIGGGPIHDTTTSVDAPDVIDVSSCHRILTDQVHSLRGGTGEPVKSQSNNFTLSSLYDSSAEMSAGNNTDLFGRVMAGDFNTVKSMTPSPQRPFGKIPQRRGDCGFRPPYISTPTDENMKMHMTGSTNPSTVYSHGLFTQLGQYSGDETTSSSVCGGTYPPAVKPTPFQGRSFDQAKRQRSISAPESDQWDFSNKSGSCAGTFARPPNATYNQSASKPSNNITFGHRGDGTFASPANATYERPIDATFSHRGDGTFTCPANATYARPIDATFSHRGDGTFTGPANATYARPIDATFSHPGDGTFACPANATYARKIDATFSHPGNGTFVQSANNTSIPTGAGLNQGNATYPQARKTQRCTGQSLHSQIEAFPAANQIKQSPPERTPPTYYPSGESSVYEDTSSNFLPSPTGNTAVGGGFRPMYCSTAYPNSNAFMDDVSTMPNSIRPQKPLTPGRNATYPPRRQPLQMENQSLRSASNSPDRVGLRPATAYGSGRNLQGNSVSFRLQSEHNDGSEQYQNYSHISSCQEALCDEECAFDSSNANRAQEYSHISSCEEALCTEDCSQEPRQDLYDTSWSGSSPQLVAGGLRRGGNFYGSESSQDMHTSAGGLPAQTGLKRGDYYGSGQNLYGDSPRGLKRGNFYGSGQNLNRSETSICDCSS